jgi:hypothetical protein
MIEHASDCALHNAPAAAPEACSCGASRVFRKWGYDISQDTFGWRPFCRETAASQVASSSLARLYSADLTRLGRINRGAREAMICEMSPESVMHYATHWPNGIGVGARVTGQPKS